MPLAFSSSVSGRWFQRSWPVFLASFAPSRRSSLFPGVLHRLGFFTPNPCYATLFFQPQTLILFHLLHFLPFTCLSFHNLCSKLGASHLFWPSNLNLPSQFRPLTGMPEKWGQACCGLAQSEGVLDASLALIPSHLFWFLVLLVGACVGGSDLVFLLRCGAFGGEIWLGSSLCCELEIFYAIPLSSLTRSWFSLGVYPCGHW